MLEFIGSLLLITGWFTVAVGGYVFAMSFVVASGFPIAFFFFFIGGLAIYGSKALHTKKA